jgi:hypothetical protein
MILMAARKSRQHPRMLQLASRCSAFVYRLTSRSNGTFSGHWPKAWKQVNVRPLRKPAKAADSVAGWRPTKRRFYPLGMGP